MTIIEGIIILFLALHPGDIFEDVDSRIYSRFECNCGCGMNSMSPRLVRMINEIEEQISDSLRITSAYRCEAYNSIVGGVPNSSHTLGLAVDIAVYGNTERYRIIKIAKRNGFKRIGISKNFIHLDIDHKKGDAIWWY